MRTAQFALLVGLALGAILAFGGVGAFCLVVIFGAIGAAVGLTLEGRLDVQALTERWRK